MGDAFDPENIMLDTTLASTLEQYCKNGDWLGIVYTVTETCWVRKTGGEWLRHGERRLAWEDAYEVRVFNEAGEVRWWQEDLVNGRAAKVRIDDSEHYRTQERRWLLWGDYVTHDEKWTTLAEARIGEVHVPTPPGDRKEKDRVALVVTEVWTKGDYGNVSVADEILTRLEWIDPKDPAAQEKENTNDGL